MARKNCPPSTPSNVLKAGGRILWRTDPMQPPSHCFGPACCQRRSPGARPPQLNAAIFSSAKGVGSSISCANLHAREMTMILCGRAEKRKGTRRKQTEFTTEGSEAITWCFGGLKMGNAMKLYNHALAPNPRRVRIFAAEKGIELTLQDVDVLAGQSRTPEFLAKNPSGGVPVLELEDGSCLAESVAICRYLEGLHPEPNLFGRDLREQAQIEMWNRRMELEL